MVTVTGIDKGKSVTVRINDRGPAIRSRIIDLSAAAAKQIEMIEDGIIDVSVTVVENETP
jgi:rare lipoprotein A